jgi:hypothetical protein
MPPVLGPVSPSRSRLWSCEARFLAGQKCFDDDPRLCTIVGHGHFSIDKHRVDRRVRFARTRGHDHAFACRKPVRLDHDRRTSIIDMGVRFGGIGEGAVFGRRNAVAGHEGLGEILGAFELRGSLGRTENFQAGVAKCIDYAFGKRRFRTDDRQADALALRECDQVRDRCQRDIAELALARRAPIAGRDEDFGDTARLGDFPRQRMLASAAANDQDIHRIRSRLSLHVARHSALANTL